ncbi:hypothetical protein B0T36_06845 [Nocardia donostiensis]|uniref:hypothetical protein n=1 Tax=Nocardia donostiensis TaxID=1538463 RepID=UPI0009DB1A25|nr:hypothetical protein [Nocardia donostiensis]OQS15702.1 hypothetical protein B0T36_06845 [Nocardia donostiensis]
MNHSDKTKTQRKPEYPPETEPLDQQAIHVATQTFPVEHILDMIDSGDIDTTHEEQHAAPWSPTDKSRLIESMLIRIPLPAIYFLETNPGTLQTVNGHQCLNTIHTYLRGESFRLQGLRYLTDENGKAAAELPAPLRRELMHTRVVAHVIRSPIPYRELCDILRRNNAAWRPFD